MATTPHTGSGAAPSNCPSCGPLPGLMPTARFCPLCGSPVSTAASAIAAKAPERELHSTEVLGWRAWDVHKLGKLVRLGSVSSHGHWPVADWIYAECGGIRSCESSSDGRCPGENCSCGLYSARDLEQLTDELPYANYDNRQVKVIGQVAMAGKVVVGTQGFRAEKARVAHLYVPHTHWKLGRTLSKQYGVPYDTLRWIG